MLSFQTCCVNSQSPVEIFSGPARNRFVALFFRSAESLEGWPSSIIVSSLIGTKHKQKMAGAHDHLSAEDGLTAEGGLTRQGVTYCWRSRILHRTCDKVVEQPQRCEVCSIVNINSNANLNSEWTSLEISRNCDYFRGNPEDD